MYDPLVLQQLKLLEGALGAFAGGTLEEAQALIARYKRNPQSWTTKDSQRIQQLLKLRASAHNRQPHTPFS